MNKIKDYTKRWGNDYTYFIYFLRIFGYAISLIYFIITFFNKQKVKKFNKKNPLFLLRDKEISKWNEPEDKKFNEKFLYGDKYNFNGIYFPKTENTCLMRMVYEDSLKIYTEFGDDYSYKIVDPLEKTLPEGTYCYITKDNEKITIEKNDVVIDAGAWIGDFSAYAAKKGAHVYSFEPSPNNISLLKKTIEFNSFEKDIEIVPYGLGEKEEVLDFYENESNKNTGGNSFNIKDGDGNTSIHVTTLDMWAKRNNINKIDFIKSDIEGFERHLLRGAKNILKRDSPRLAICTYHLPDDKEVIKNIILEANPKYTIIQRKMKLFAFVKK